MESDHFLRGWANSFFDRRGPVAWFLRERAARGGRALQARLEIETRTALTSMIIF